MTEVTILNVENTRNHISSHRVANDWNTEPQRNKTQSPHRPHAEFVVGALPITSQPACICPSELSAQPSVLVMKSNASGSHAAQFPFPVFVCSVFLSRALLGVWYKLTQLGTEHVKGETCKPRNVDMTQKCYVKVTKMFFLWFINSPKMCLFARFLAYKSSIMSAASEDVHKYYKLFH